MTKNLRILIVEDEFMTRRLLKKKLAEFGHEVVGDVDTVAEANAILGSRAVDLVILDINLGPKEDGIRMGELINAHSHVPFIYLTAYETADIVGRALLTQPRAYMTKPFNEVELMTTLAIVAQEAAKAEATAPLGHLPVKEGKLTKQLALEEIMLIESEGNYVVVHTTTERHRLRTTVKELMDQLPLDRFVQVHRAFIVNKGHVGAHGWTALEVGGMQVPIAKGKRQEVREALGGQPDAEGAGQPMG